MASPSSVPVREQWGGALEVILSYIGYSVGLGNIWRFSYLCYKHGGGAFLVPYLITVALAGTPIFYLEIALGQYSACSATTAWSFCPLFKGIGYCMMIMCTMWCAYFYMIMGYALNYLVASMTTELPWATCGNPWNTPLCRSSQSVEEDLSGNVTSLLNSTISPVSVVYNVTNATIKYHSAAEEYWENYILNKGDGLYPAGALQWRLVLSLAASVVIVFLCVVKGIKSTGKVVYFTATFPYLIIFILLIRGATLPGAVDGILLYIIPEWSKLTDVTVWGDAASQIFFSTGQAWGILITLGSYNKFNHPSGRDALIACTVGPATSILAGFVVFSVIGFLAKELNTPLSEVMASGPGLAFVAYPEALARMPIAPLWSFMFFFMLAMVAVDSTFATLETLVAAIVDEYPAKFRRRRVWVTVTCSIFLFFANLPTATRAGVYIMTLIDWYGLTIPPLCVAFLEAIVVSYIYGWRRFADNINEMLGAPPNYYWIISWTVSVPVITFTIVCFNIAMYTPATHDEYVYPGWAEAVGWMLFSAGLICIPIYAVYAMYRKAGGIRELCSSPLSTTRALLQPSPDWKANCPIPHSPEEKEAALNTYNLETILTNGEQAAEINDEKLKV